MADTTTTTSKPLPEPTLPQKFFTYFQHEITALQHQLASLPTRSLIAGERADATDHCLAGITRLSSEVKDAATYLPPYDQRTYAEAVRALMDKWRETKRGMSMATGTGTGTGLAPGGRERFTFKGKGVVRKSPSAVSISDAVELARERRRGVPGYVPSSGEASKVVSRDELEADEEMMRKEQEDGVENTGAEERVGEIPATEATLQPDSSPTEIIISSKSNTNIHLPPAHPPSTNPTATTTRLPASLSNITSSLITPPPASSSTPPLASLTLSNLTTTFLLTPPILGPTHITSTHSTALLLFTRQLRIHSSSNLTIYLFSSSRPIIENSTNIKFAPVPDWYIQKLLQESSSTSGDTATEMKAFLDSTNHWSSIDDFQWLKSAASPNFSLIPESERIPDQTWQNIITESLELASEEREDQENKQQQQQRRQEILKSVGISMETQSSSS